jgi:hypothetical protein
MTIISIMYLPTAGMAASVEVSTTDPVSVELSPVRGL